MISVFLGNLKQVYKCPGFEAIKSHTFILRNFHVKASLIHRPRVSCHPGVLTRVLSLMMLVRECPGPGLRRHSGSLSHKLFVPETVFASSTENKTNHQELAVTALWRARGLHHFLFNIENAVLIKKKKNSSNQSKLCVPSFFFVSGLALLNNYTDDGVCW